MKHAYWRVMGLLALIAFGFALALIVNGTDGPESRSDLHEVATLRQEVRDLQSALLSAQGHGAESSPTLAGNNLHGGSSVRRADVRTVEQPPPEEGAEKVPSESEFLKAIDWRVIRSSLEISTRTPMNMSEEEEKAYKDRMMVVGMQAMGELMKLIERYDLDAQRPDMKGEAALLTRMLRLTLPKVRPDLTEKERRAIQDAASAYSEEQERVAGRTSETLVMRKAALKRANLVQLRTLISALSEDADLSVVSLILTDLDHSANYKIHATRADAQAAMIASLRSDLSLDNGQSADVARLVSAYLSQLAGVPRALYASYPHDVVDGHYARSKKSPYAYHPGGPVQFPAAWPEDRKRQGLLLHVAAQSAFLDAEAQLHAEMRRILSPEQWENLSNRAYQYQVVRAEHPGDR